MATDKILIMASKTSCGFCNAMKPVFESIVKEYTGLPGLTFANYDVDSDDWELADKFGLEGVPGFVICNSDATKVYEVNNDGLIDRSVLVSMIINNIGKD